jgi:hypothetical protein
LIDLPVKLPDHANVRVGKPGLIAKPVLDFAVVWQSVHTSPIIKFSTLASLQQ